MKRLSVVLVSALLLTLLIPSPVSAVPPYTDSWIDAKTEEAVDCTEFGYDFWIDDDVVNNVRWTAFFDQEGNEVRGHLRVTGVDNLYNRNNPDYKISATFSWNYFEDMLTGETKVTGALWHVTLPGYGNVFFDTGQGAWGPDGYEPIMGHHELDPILCEVLDYPTAPGARAASAELNNFLFLPAVVAR